MGVLDGLQPQLFFHCFEELTRIPRGSGDMRRISDYLAAFARDRGYETVQDEALNVIVRIPATPGHADRAPLILQGHMDMVAVRDAASAVDPTKDALRLGIDGDLIYAEGTSLGGDDGFAIACFCALMEDRSIEHPALTLVMTTDEETGMNGARAVDPALLDADCLVNLDSEEEGVLLAGCAGGVRVDVRMSGNVLRMRGRRAVLKIAGLLGGHSGMEIVKERGNAVLIAGRILQALRDDGCVFGIAGASGGDADNAIPAATAVDLVFPADEENGIRRAQETIRCEAAAIRRELGRRDPDLTCALVRPGSSDPADGTEPVSDGVPVLDEDLAERTAAFLCTAPNGVQSMSADLPGLVETSLNLGVMRTELPDRAELCFGFALRSSRESARDALRRRLELLAGRFGAESTISGEYNGWAFDPDSRICGHFADTWERMNGSRPRIEAIHAGLECGLFRGLKPGLDCVSLGPDLEHVHTTKERMHIASAGRTWAFLLEALRTWDVKK